MQDEPIVTCKNLTAKTLGMLNQYVFTDINCCFLNNTR